MRSLSAKFAMIVGIARFGNVSLSVNADAAPPRVKDGAELYDKCKNDPLYCDETFDTYRTVYAVMVIPELREKPENKEMVKGYEERKTFEGICLPREKLFDEKFAEDLSKLFVKWAKPRRESLVGVPSGETVRRAYAGAVPMRSQLT
jgi:hypothetical protein